MTSAAFSFARATLARDLSISVRSGGGWFYAILFFFVFAALAGIAIGPELPALASAAPAINWLAAAFAIQLTVAEVFEDDFRDGSLAIIAAEQVSLFPYFFAKVVLVGLIAAAPMIAASPVILTMFGVSPEHLLGAAMLLAIGLPGLVLTALFAAALAAGLRRGGLLAVVIAAPFLAPPLIFGVLSIEAYISSGIFWSPETFVLAALSLFMAAIAPPFSVVALRLGLE